VHCPVSLWPTLNLCVRAGEYTPDVLVKETTSLNRNPPAYKIGTSCRNGRAPPHAKSLSVSRSIQHGVNYKVPVIVQVCWGPCRMQHAADCRCCILSLDPLCRCGWAAPHDHRAEQACDPAADGGASHSKTAQPSGPRAHRHQDWVWTAHNTLQDFGFSQHSPRVGSVAGPPQQHITYFKIWVLTAVHVRAPSQGPPNSSSAEATRRRHLSPQAPSDIPGSASDPWAPASPAARASSSSPPRYMEPIHDTSP